ncbi:hypothetical protein DMP14_31720 [Pseudonocardia sp. Ae707_Ps2]
MSGVSRAPTPTSTGWHLHIHALLIFPTDVSAEIPALTCEVYTRWAAGLAKKGMSATAEHGIDVRVGNGAVGEDGQVHL